MDAISKFIAALSAEREERLRDFCAHSSIHESPIETMLAGALRCTADLFDLEVNVTRISAKRVLEMKVEREVAFVCPQERIGAYRVDFLLLASCEFSAGWHKLVIECDGHDFHERTKEQAARDRARDRTLQEQGYTVFRFTGSEIHRDLYGCAKQIHDWTWARFSDDFARSMAA